MHTSADDELPPRFDGHRIYRRARVRRNALTLAGAAAVVVIAAGSTVGLTVGGEQGSPGPAATGAVASDARPADGGAVSVPVPKIVGLTWDEAVNVLRAVGLKAEPGPNAEYAVPPSPKNTEKPADGLPPKGPPDEMSVKTPGWGLKVVGSRPIVGVPVPVGGTVTLMLHPGKS